MRLQLTILDIVLGLILMIGLPLFVFGCATAREPSASDPRLPQWHQEATNAIVAVGNALAPATGGASVAVSGALAYMLGAVLMALGGLGVHVVHKSRDTQISPVKTDPPK